MITNLELRPSLLDSDSYPKLVTGGLTRDDIVKIKSRMKYLLEPFVSAWQVIPDILSVLPDITVAGGAITRIVGNDYNQLGEIESDVDIYLPTKTVSYQRGILISALKEMGAKKRVETDFGEKWEYKPNNIDNPILYDIIKIGYDTPASLISSFDFTISQFAVRQGTLYFNPDAVTDIRERRIKINKSARINGRTVWRIMKYAQRGFKMWRQDVNDFLSAMNVDENYQIGWAHYKKFTDEDADLETEINRLDNNSGSVMSDFNSYKNWDTFSDYSSGDMYGGW